MPQLPGVTSKTCVTRGLRNVVNVVVVGLELRNIINSYCSRVFRKDDDITYPPGLPIDMLLSVSAAMDTKGPKNYWKRFIR